MNKHFWNVPIRTARLEMTDELISSLDGAAQEEELRRDIQRMQELLSLPKNEEKAASSAAEGGTWWTAWTSSDPDGLEFKSGSDWISPLGKKEKKGF